MNIIMINLTFQKIYDVVKSIPPGKVSTYGHISKELGLKSPRIIGLALHNNPDQKSIPCHRVVNAKGELSKHFAFGGDKAQKHLLEKEGVQFYKGRIDLSLYQF
jgi:O-6-methylguanine DNA methyltransferase